MQGAAPVTIDERAPVIGVHEIEIAADPATVWAVLAAIEGWPSWNPAVREATLSGPLAVGSQFRWKAGPGTITSTLLLVEPPRTLAWRGKTMGIKAIHVYRLGPRDGKTIVSSEESWDGLPVRLLRGRMQRMLDDALQPGLARLKAEAERRATRRAGGGPD